MGKQRSYYGLPDKFFPRVESERPTHPFEEKVRSLALTGYKHSALPDNELRRFMQPVLPWGQLTSSQQSFFKPFGLSSWVASPDQAPFIPQECLTLITKVFSDPRSLAHIVGVRGQIRIMYLADELTVELSSYYGPATLFIVVVAPHVRVTLQDTAVFLDALCARLLVGSLAEGAHVTFKGDYTVARTGFCLQHDYWSIGSQASLVAVEGLTGGVQSWLRKEFAVQKEAEVSFTWLAALCEGEQAALTTVQEHEGPSSKSSVRVKAALSQEARSFYRGTIRIHEQAVQSEADQQQRALLISGDAKVCAIPSLEVETHEVQCAHGSAAGRFKDDELLYLQSRGLDREHAEQLLIEAFFNEEIDSSVKHRLKERLMKAASER